MRKKVSATGVPVGRGTQIRSTTSRRSSWEMAARRSLRDSGTGFELGVEATSLMTTTPVSSRQLREKRQQFGVEGRRVADVRGMAAVWDDDLPARLHGADQQVGLRLRNKRVVLTPDCLHWRSNLTQAVLVFLDRHRSHGDETCDLLRSLGYQRQRVPTTHRRGDDDRFFDFQQVEKDPQPGLG